MDDHQKALEAVIEQPHVEQPAPEVAENKRVIAALGYLPFLCFMPLLMRDKGDFLAFHARQGLVLTLGAIIMTIVGPILTIFVPVVGMFIALALNIVLAFLILLGASKAHQGEMWELPIIGAYARNVKI